MRRISLIVLEWFELAEIGDTFAKSYDKIQQNAYPFLGLSEKSENAS